VFRKSNNPFCAGPNDFAPVGKTGVGHFGRISRVGRFVRVHRHGRQGIIFP
jgi:hypothetical protein